MGIALLAASTLAHPLTALHRWWNRQRPSFPQRDRGMHSEMADPPRPTGALHAMNTSARPTAAGPQDCAMAASRPAPARPSACPARTAPAPVHPLRVLRRHGRMVITGRMADVCAELERLAACEPQH